MSIPAWDDDLPTRLQISGYSEAMPNNILKTSMEVGPAKSRRRSTAGPRNIDGKLRLTSTQIGTLKTFYNTTLLNGSLRFSWTEPLDGTTAVEMRFREPPSWTSLSGNLFEVILKLEVLP